VTERCKHQDEPFEYPARPSDPDEQPPRRRPARLRRISLGHLRSPEFAASARSCTLHRAALGKAMRRTNSSQQRRRRNFRAIQRAGNHKMVLCILCNQPYRRTVASNKRPARRASRSCARVPSQRRRYGPPAPRTVRSARACRGNSPVPRHSLRRRGTRVAPGFPPPRRRSTFRDRGRGR
jgi:hypothetical protein